MDQVKIGRFLKQLRSEKALTQQQLAEWLGVSDRSVSRWENGVTLPDLDLLIQLADRYGVDIRELLDGQRKAGGPAQDGGPANGACTLTEKETRQTLLQAADYSNQQKLQLSGRLRGIFLAGLAAFLVYLLLEGLPLPDTRLYGCLTGFMQGIVLGVLLLGVLFSTRWMGRVRAAKLRLLHKLHLRRGDAD